MVFGPLDFASARNGTSGSTGLIEATQCSYPAPAHGAVDSGAPNTQTITVTVPSVALLRTDHGNHVVAAMTNTGCAPRPSDQLWFVRPDGSLEAAPTSEMANRHWIGNFTNPGVYVSQVH